MTHRLAFCLCGHFATEHGPNLGTCAHVYGTGFCGCRSFRPVPESTEGAR